MTNTRELILTQAHKLWAEAAEPGEGITKTKRAFARRLTCGRIVRTKWEEESASGSAGNALKRLAELSAGMAQLHAEHCRAVAAGKPGPFAAGMYPADRQRAASGVALHESLSRIAKGEAVLVMAHLFGGASMRELTDLGQLVLAREDADRRDATLKQLPALLADHMDALGRTMPGGGTAEEWREMGIEPMSDVTRALAGVRGGRHGLGEALAEAQLDLRRVAEAQLKRRNLPNVRRSELLSDVFVDTAKKDGGARPLGSEELERYFRVRAFNKIRERTRTEAREIAVEIPEMEVQADADEQIERQAARKVLADYIQGKARENPRDAAIFVAYLEDHTTGAIAERFEVSEKTVKNVVSRCKQELEERLHQKGFPQADLTNLKRAKNRKAASHGGK